MNEHDDLTTQLTRTLTDHADEMTAASLGLDRDHRAAPARSGAGVRRPRSSVPRPRWLSIVPTWHWRATPAASPEPAPAVTHDAHPDHRRSRPPATATSRRPGVLDVSDLPTGAAPRDGATSPEADAAPDRRRAPSDIPTHYPVSSFVALTDGSHVWLTTHGGTPYVEVQDGNGTCTTRCRAAGT